MKTFFDCLPCFLKQTLAAYRMATGDEAIHGRVLTKVLRLAIAGNIMDFALMNHPKARG